MTSASDVKLTEQSELLSKMNELKDLIILEDTKEKERFSALSKHMDILLHEEMVEAANLYKSLRKTDGIPIESFPAALQPSLKAFDQDDNGTISAEELARGAELYRDSQKRATVLFKALIGLTATIVVLVGTIAGATYGLIEAAKETHTGFDGVMRPAEEGEDGVAEAVSTGSASEQVVLDSGNGDFFWKATEDIAFSGYDNKLISLKVSGFLRQPCDSCASGTSVTLMTDYGIVDVVDRAVSFTPTAELLAVDAGLSDFNRWRRGGNAPTPLAGDASQRRMRRSMLSQATADQEAAESQVLAAGGLDSTSYADTSSLSDFWGEAKCKSKQTSCMKDTNNNMGGNIITYLPLSSKPYSTSFAIDVPDNLSFQVYKGKNSWIGFHVLPSTKGNGKYDIPGGFKWEGVTSGEMEYFWTGVNDENTKGTMKLKKGKNDFDSFGATYNTDTGVQVAFMTEIDADKLGSDFSDAMASYDGVANAFVTVEVVFTIPKAGFNGLSKRRGNSFTGITSLFRVSLNVAVGGFNVNKAVFESEGSWAVAEKYRVENGDFDIDSTLRMTDLGSDTLAQKLLSGLQGMLAEAVTLDVVHEAIETLDESTAYKKVASYFDFAEAVNQANGGLGDAQGDAGELALEAFTEPQNIDAIGHYLGVATTKIDADVGGITEVPSKVTSKKTKQKKKGKKKKKKNKN